MVRLTLAVSIAAIIVGSAGSAEADRYRPQYHPRFVAPEHTITTEPVLLKRARRVGYGVVSPGVVEYRPIFSTPRPGWYSY